MSKADHISLDELKQRKERIAAELIQIQNELDDSVSDVKESVISSVIPSQTIRKQPFKSVAIAITVGFILGLPKLTKSRGSRRQSQTSERGMTSLFSDELKRYATRRAVTYLVNSIDDQLTDRFFPAKRSDERES